MDNHGSHRTPQFILLAIRHHIIPYSFPAHLTHCIQPLDVGVFQPYKHWHNKAIQCAMENLNFEYTIASFLCDLAEIRIKIFSKSTIKDSFRKAGLWPVNVQAVKDKMKKYVKTIQVKPSLPELPEPKTPQTVRQVEKQCY